MRLNKAYIQENLRNVLLASLPLGPPQWSSDVASAHYSLFQTSTLRCHGDHQTPGLLHAYFKKKQVLIYFTKGWEILHLSTQTVGQNNQDSFEKHFYSVLSNLNKISNSARRGGVGRGGHQD